MDTLFFEIADNIISDDIIPLHNEIVEQKMHVYYVNPPGPDPTIDEIRNALPALLKRSDV